MSVLLPKNLDKSKILNQVADSSFHFDNGLQTSTGPWKTNKNARRATVCPDVQKSQKKRSSVKDARKSVPGDKAPKIKLDGPLKRRKKSAKQIEKAEQEYAFFDSSQDEGEVEGEVKEKEVGGNPVKLAAESSGKKSTPAAVSKSKARARQIKTKTPPAKKTLPKSDKNSPRPSSPIKRKQKEPDSPLKKVKASLKKSSVSKTPVKKAKNTPKKTPGKLETIKKTPAKKTPAKITPAKKTPAKKTPAKKTPSKKTPAKTPTKKTPAKTVPAKKTPAAAKKPAKEFAIGSRKSTRLGK